MENMKTLRYGWLGALLICMPFANAAFNPVGIWKAGIQHGKLSAADAEKVRRIRAGVEGGSFKVNKNKTFGLSLAGRVMMGTWTLKGDILSIAVKEMLGAVTVPVIASGGIGSVEDVRALAAQAAPNLEGVIIGKALYTGSVSLADAIAVE